MAWRASAQGAFQKQTMTEIGSGAYNLGLDGAGNLLVAGEASQNSTTDLIAYRGTVSSGLGSPQTLETRGAPATFVGLSMGVNGHALVLWSQSNGTATVVFAATASTPTAAFAVADLGSLSSAYMAYVVTDAGQAIIYDFLYKVSVRGSGGTWSAAQSLPAELSVFGFAINVAVARNGNILVVYQYTGIWTSYDAATNAMVQRPTTATSGTGFILGVSTNVGIGLRDLQLATSGVGAAVLMNSYDVLPTPGAPAGDGRGVANLWGLYLK